MKNLTRIGALLALLFSSCDKYEPLINSRDNPFPDFDYTAVYFPIQYPIRTIDLATDARINNAVDLEHRFHIGIAMGGLYENRIEREVRFEYDPSLLIDSMQAVPSQGATLDSILLLPEEYYQLTPSSGSLVIIPEQSFNGMIEVQLTDAFFEDSLALLNSYVIPLRITDAINVDSVLTGLPVQADPVKTNSAHWDAGAQPRDFTLFMVKFINAYHGDYLIRGVDYTLDGSNNRVDTVIYRDKYLTNNKLVKLKSAGLNEIVTNHTGDRISDNGDYALLLDISESGSVNITSMSGTSFIASGTGTYMSRDASPEVWGGETRKSFYLHYNYLDGAENHEVFDTIVFRHTGTVIEYFTPLW